MNFTGQSNSLREGIKTASRYDINLEEYGITKAVQRELKYFFLSYPDKKAQLEGIYELKRKPLNGMPAAPHSGASITARQAEMAERLRKDVETVECAVAAACGEDVGIFDVLLKNLTEDKPLKIQKDKTPCGINQLYSYRRKAFFYLWKLKK